jgi:3-isopropylmalate/(R)-2-methylmalate dehydratase large subunit
MHSKLSEKQYPNKTLATNKLPQTSALKTIFDKIWESHVVKEIPDGPSVLYIDRHYIHEVTSPQAFEGLRERGLKVFRPGNTIATCDHNVPTLNQEKPIEDPESRIPIEKLAINTAEHGIKYFPLGDPGNGIVHIIGPEHGLTQCGMTIVCGDSHTSTHGAFGNIAFGIGTSEVEMVLATQTLLQHKPKQMLIEVKGALRSGVCSKDLILHIIAQLGTSGGTGYFLEFTGDTIKNLSMEARMTICNMSIEMGAKGAIIAPDTTTFEYLKKREYSPHGAEWEKAVARWKQLHSDPGAIYDAHHTFDATTIQPRITYGTNPALSIALHPHLTILHPTDKLTSCYSPDQYDDPANKLAEETTPNLSAQAAQIKAQALPKAQAYQRTQTSQANQSTQKDQTTQETQGTQANQTPQANHSPQVTHNNEKSVQSTIYNKKIDYVFLGSCTNGRIEDFRAFASIVKGRKKNPEVIAWLVPGSKLTEKLIEEEGIGDILREAGFTIRQPGCSACLAMNEDKIPPDKYCVSTSNRNFEGRQGPGSHTLLAGPLVAAAAAITGRVTDPRIFLTDKK